MTNLSQGRCFRSASLLFFALGAIAGFEVQGSFRHKNHVHSEKRTLKADRLAQTNGLNESKVIVQVKFRKGKPIVDEKDIRFSMSGLFCEAAKCVKNSDGTWALADRTLKNKLLKKLSYSLAQMPSLVDVATAPLFDYPELQEPRKPPDTATDVERNTYSQELVEYSRKLDAIGKLRESINAISLTAQMRTYDGSWDAVFRFDQDDPQNNGLFERWRQAISSSVTVKSAYCAVCTAYDNSCDGEDTAFCDRCEDICQNEDAPMEVSDRALVVNNAFDVPLVNGLADSFLILTMDDESPNVVIGNGFVTLGIRDPLPLHLIRPADLLSYQLEPANEANALNSALQEAGLPGSFWSREEIEFAIKDYYARKGYTVGVLWETAEERYIRILPLRLEYIKLPPLKEKTTELFRVLQRVLPTKAFDEFVRNTKADEKEKYLQCSEPGNPLPICKINLKLSGEADAQEGFKSLIVGEDYLSGNKTVLKRINAGLQNIDYEASLLGGETTKTFLKSFLSVSKVEEKPGAGPGDGAPTPPPLSESGTPSPTPARASTPAASPTPVPSPMPSPNRFREKLDRLFEGNLYKVCPRGNNWFYGGIDFRPGQGTKLIGGYKCLKAGPGSLGFEIGSDSALLGGANYSGHVPFIKIGEREYPTFIQVEASSDFERSRLFGGVKTDERRSGGSLRAIQPLLMSVDGKSQAEVMLQLRRQTIALQGDNQSLSKHNLTTIEAGFRYFFQNELSPRSSRFEIAPQVKFGLGVSSDEPKFTMLSLPFSFHRELTHAFDADVKSRLAWASGRTPIFEQPTFGGEDFVRGFRKDEAIGLSLWAIQSEIWLRLRGIVPPSFSYKHKGQGKLRSLIRNDVSLAVFYDIGGAHRTTFSPSGTRAGVGVGLRFNYNRAALFKLDWAYGLGNGNADSRKGRFYFTFELPENSF